PLIDKILSRPLLIERLRSLIGDTRRALILPFMTTLGEVELAARLGVPVYGPDPSLAALGTKSGARRLFAEAGIPHPPGQEAVHTIADLVEAIGKLAAANPGIEAAMVKLDDSAGGLGNAVVRLQGVESETDLRRRIESLEVEDSEGSPEEFFAELETRGGIVEERITGPEVRSPSAQLRANPQRQVEILSTHDQLLGGATGQTFLGCRFPADQAYGALIARLAERIGWIVAREGVIGRFGVDFVVARRGESWYPYAIEINLRNGGTTHPMLTMQALTGGEFDPNEGRFHTSQGERFYVATDHLESPGFAALTPDDILDYADEDRLGWDPDRLTGVALHLVSAVAVAGRLGLTAVGLDPDDAQSRLESAEGLVNELARA
ncbi:MAG TPA: peptide ligase PGM1-related protein, partial [Acidimicrobiia bacterium]|nr:peptide ligase PGM1-related protein [Acidimicrobiia bacterium]